MQIVYLADYPQHIPKVAQWAHKEWHAVFPELNYQQTLEHYLFSAVKDKIPMTMLALDKGKPIGSVTLTSVDRTNSKPWSPWQLGVFVEDEARGFGVASQLIKAMETQAKAQGVDTLFIATSRAEAFYQSMGWFKTGSDVHKNNTLTFMNKHL